MNENLTRQLFEQFCHIYLFIFQVYAGGYENLRVVSSRVNKVTDRLTALKEDVFVAVNIEG